MRNKLHKQHQDLPIAPLFNFKVEVFHLRVQPPGVVNPWLKAQALSRGLKTLFVNALSPFQRTLAISPEIDFRAIEGLKRGCENLQHGKNSKFPQPCVSPKNILPFFRKVGSLCFSLSTSLLLTATPSWSQTQPSAQDLDLSPEIIKNSPVLQRWRRQVPNVLEDIKNDPSFRTRWRIGYFQFPSTGQTGGVNVGVADIFIGKSGLTVSGEYQATFNGKREAYGADLHYYLRPLGNYINVATVLGYRYLETSRYSTSGVNVGAKLLLVLSRKGAADISLTQTWVSPGSDEEVGLTTLSVGYAVTRNLRLSTDIQKQNARQHKDSRVGVVLEWMP